ncbi:MAG TPA: hypothetical protein VHB54_09490 [Mucilaginibacter sp.]|nr:hypothetical protein [Bacteroidota bacterium]HVS93333.1 hypothetical protein [Mucilaginibacter sp.]HVW14045.1 hypothetical protein [Mucilaginibacter sp.]
MVSKKELQSLYSTLPTEKLMEIIDNKFGYTELAVSVAFEELAGRKISEEEIKSYKSKQIEKLNSYIRKNISNDLSLSQKNLFYFIFIPLLTWPFKQGFREKGYRLKTKQATYYSMFGFAFFLVGLVFALQGYSNLFVIALWIGGFIPAYLMDEFFNRQRQIKKLQEIFGPIEPEEAHTEQDA